MDRFLHTRGVHRVEQGSLLPWIFLLSLLLSPLIGVIAALAARSNTTELENERIDAGKASAVRSALK